MKLSRLLLLPFSLLALSPLPAAAQDKPVSLRLSHWVPPSHPLQKSMEQWLDAVGKASGGTITGTVFPAQQLGKAFDHYNMARDGIADVAHVNPGYEPGRFPVMGAMELPFLFANAKAGSAALDAWYRKYAAKEMADVKYCLTFAHDPGTFHSTKKKIVLPADVKGAAELNMAKRSYTARRDRIMSLYRVSRVANLKA